MQSNCNIQSVKTEDNELKHTLANLITSKQVDLKKEILEAKEPEYLHDLPIILSELNGSAVMNMVVADAGMGKSLFTRCLISELVERDDFIVLWFDYEYIPTVSKERKFSELLDTKNFRLITPNLIDDVRKVFQKENKRVKTTATITNRIIRSYREQFPDKRIFVIVDSLEDYIEDTSDDAEIKRVFTKALSIKGTTYLLNHHISKDKTQSKTLRFRGSMVIKATVASTMFINKKVPEDDFTYLFEFYLYKIRTAYKPIQKFTVRLNVKDFTIIGNPNITADSEEIKILKSAFFTLKKESTLTKTKLIDVIVKNAHKHKDKVRAVLDKHKGMFDIEKGDKRLEVYSLTTDIDRIEKYQAMLGLGDIGLSKVKAELLKEIEDRDLEEDVNIKVPFNGRVVSYQKFKTIRYSLYKMTDEEAEFILKKLQEANSKLRKEVLDLAEEVPEDDNPVFETLDKYGVMNRKDLEEHIGNIPIDVLKDFKEILEKTPTGV